MIALQCILAWDIYLILLSEDLKDISPEKFVKMAKEHKWKLKGKRFQR